MAPWPAISPPPAHGSRPRRTWARCIASLLAALPLLVACTPGTPEVQRLQRYESLLERPLAERVLPADAAVLERAHRTNLDFGDDVRPRAAAPGHRLTPVVREALAGLPPAVTRVAGRHLAAVYLVEHDAGTATTEGVQGPDGRWRHAYIVLNLTALERDANAWATWKERSAFRPAAGYDLRVTIEPAPSDDRLGAVRFILLHELGHVLGLGLGVHGYWDAEDPLPPAATGLSPFAAGSWELAEVQGKPTLRSRFAAREPKLGGLGFYRFDRAPHSLAEAPALYAALEHTNFPSLYGATQVYDDFAESFAITVHTQLLGKPYEVELLREGRRFHVYRSCIVTGHCTEKAALVHALLDAAEPGQARPGGLRLRMSMQGGAGIGR
jgi:hypothetical protein